jgi:hypothetical protein
MDCLSCYLVAEICWEPIYADNLLGLPASMKAHRLFREVYENTRPPLDATARVRFSDEDREFPHCLFVTASPSCRDAWHGVASILCGEVGECAGYVR